MKTMITTALVAVFAASVSFADGNNGNNGNNSSNFGGSFSGGVSAFSSSGGASFSSSFGGDTDSSIRNESGSGQFSGVNMNFSNDENEGTTTMSTETFTEGFDFSSTEAGGGFGGAFAGREGIAGANGGFGSNFGSEFEFNQDSFSGLGNQSYQDYEEPEDDDD